jgi:hypothetical protein
MFFLLEVILALKGITDNQLKDFRNNGMAFALPRPIVLIDNDPVIRLAKLISTLGI